jgi:hypothetical protein
MLVPSAVTVVSRFELDEEVMELLGHLEPGKFQSVEE